MPANQIFISYSKKDSDFAHKLAEDLETAGFKTWIDRSISGGDQWRETIEKNLKEAAEAIIIVSPNSMASEWVKHEGSLAYGWGKKLYPILIQPTEGLPPWLEEYQWIDFVDTKYDIAFGALIGALTPPNPIQDLLDIEVTQYTQTGDLINETIFKVIEEAYESLKITPEAEALIQKSRRRLTSDKRSNKLRRFLVFCVFAIALVITALGATGQLNRFIYRPLPMEWVEIPTGEFQMGSSDEELVAALKICSDCNYNNEQPQHRVYLDAFQIGRYETTIEQYRRCVRAHICVKHSPVIDDFEKNDYPVIFVSWDDAQTFCAWIGGRLPTEAEWEKAARGGLEGVQYSWGNEIPICQKGAFNGANFNDDLCGETGYQPVGSYQANGYGLYDMAGNVWEWTADTYDSAYYARSPLRNPQGAEDGWGRVIRGGSWFTNSSNLRVSYREFIYPADLAKRDVGFRCARDIAP